jgi:HEAT repeat protein
MSELIRVLNDTDLDVRQRAADALAWVRGH